MTQLLRRQTSEECLHCEFREMRLFCNLTGAALRRFGEIGMQLSYPGRVAVFQEGQPSSGVFVICTGRLKLSATSKEGRTMILRLAGPGDVLGLSAALNEFPHEVTAETLEPCQIKSVRRGEFMEFLEKHGEASGHAARALAKEYHEVFLDARRLALSGSVAGRLARILLEWARTSGCENTALRFTMALTHEELASLAGTSRESVTRLLSKFERDQWIARHGSSITILRPADLEQIAD